MIVLLQRVNWARVEIQGQCHGEIGKGILAFVGIEKNDNNANAEKLLDKLLAYRLFPDASGKMNLNVKEISGGILLVSQFTLAADTGSGLRPSFSLAMEPNTAESIYNEFVNKAKQKHGIVQCGRFAADMQVSLENDGPVTFILKN